MSDLKKYVEAKRTNIWGWLQHFDDEIACGMGRLDRWVRLASTYSVMLNELIEAIGGPLAVLELLEARERIRAIVKERHDDHS